MERFHAPVVMVACGLAALALLTGSAVAKKPSKSTTPANISTHVKQRARLPGKPVPGAG